MKFWRKLSDDDAQSGKSIRLMPHWVGHLKCANGTGAQVKMNRISLNQQHHMHIRLEPWV